MPKVPSWLHGSRTHDPPVDSNRLNQCATMSHHLDHLTATCSSSFYAIRKLKTHGFSSCSIHNITKSTAIAKLLYASTSWWDLTLSSNRERLEKVIRRAKRLGYLEESFQTVSDHANTADAKHFLSILHNPKHVLYQFLPQLRPHSTHQ